MTDGVIGQSTRLGFDLCADKRSINGRWQQMHPFPVGRWTSKVINHKLHRHCGGQGRIPEHMPVAQLQLCRPVGEGAAITAHGICCGAGSNKGGGRLLGVERQKMRIQRRFVDQQ